CHRGSGGRSLGADPGHVIPVRDDASPSGDPRGRDHRLHRPALPSLPSMSTQLDPHHLYAASLYRSLRFSPLSTQLPAAVRSVFSRYHRNATCLFLFVLEVASFVT